MAIGDTENNPLDLKSSGSIWQGETGTYTIPSASGSFVSFDTMADGVRAAAVDLTNAINEGYNTVSSLVYHILGTSSNNAENPHVANYLSAVEEGSGLSANQTVTSANVGQLLQGFFQGEGTASGVSSSAMSQGLQEAGLSSASAQQPTDIFDAFFNPFSSQTPLEYLPGNTTSSIAAMRSGASAVTNPTGSSGILSTLGSFGTWLSTPANRETLAIRIVLVILGLLLVAAAIFAFAKINPATVVRSAAVAA